MVMQDWHAQHDEQGKYSTAQIAQAFFPGRKIQK